MASGTLNQRRLLAAAVFLTAIVTFGTASAKTYCFPHVFDQKGRVSNTQYTFDTTMFMTYTGGVACVGDDPAVPVELYLYDNSGAPMRSITNADVCAPCSFAMDSGNRSLKLSLEELADAAGGMANFVFGHALIVVPSDKVSVQGYVVNSHTSPLDLAVFGFEPTPIASSAKSGAALPCGNVYTLNHMVATAGGGGTPYSFDTTIFMTYAAGLGGVPAGAGADVDIYLFDEATGAPLVDAVGTEVCAPCTFRFDDTQRKQSFDLGAALPGGGVVSAAVSAVLVVSGDAGAVAIQPFTVNTHTSSLDVSMSAPRLLEVTDAGLSAVPPAIAERLRLRSYPNPFNPLTTFAYSLPQADQVSVRVFDAQGVLVRTLLSEGQAPGDHEVRWDGAGDDGRALPSGVYFGRIDTSGGTETQKVMLLK